MRIFKTICTVALICGLAGGAIAKPKVVRKVKVTKDFIADEVKPNGEAKGYKFRMNMVVRNGIIEVCGVGIHTEARLREPIRQLMRGMALSMNGKVILRDFTFFAKAKSVRGLDSAVANCASTGAKLPKGKPDFSWSARRVTY